MNVILRPIHVMKMLIAITLLVASHAHVSLGILGVEKHVTVRVLNSVHNYNKEVSVSSHYINTKVTTKKCTFI